MGFQSDSKRIFSQILSYHRICTNDAFKGPNLLLFPIVLVHNNLSTENTMAEYIEHDYISS